MKQPSKTKTVGEHIFRETSEFSRTYDYGNGKTLTINNPLWVCVEKHESGMDTHRIIDTNGNGHYVSRGWVGISWKVPPSVEPFWS